MRGIRRLNGANRSKLERQVGFEWALNTGAAEKTLAPVYINQGAEAGILLIAHTDTLAGIAANRVFVAALPESDLPQITAQEVDRTENRVVEMIAVRMPPW